jgi:sialic acid synthase SpsE
MRNVHSALGVYDLIPSEGDQAARKRWFRHLVANREIPKGTVLRETMLEGKRGEEGVSPEYIELFVGRRTKRDLRENESISWQDV